LSETVSTGLEPGLVISSRYRVEERLASEGEPVGYEAVDTDHQLPVIVLDVSAAAAKALAKAKDLGHTHLANVLEVADIDGKHVVVCEQVTGETLEQRLADIGTKAPVDAVRSALRVADALSSLHEAGGAHGSVHPVNVVLAPDGRDGPVLAIAPLPAGDAAFRQPEWEAGDPPSEPDDSWSAAALLFLMLVGKPPPRTGFESESAIAEAGIKDEALQMALYHGLARDLGARSHDLRPLKRELARWFVEHAGEEPIAPGGHHSTSPPPLPPSLRTPTKDVTLLASSRRVAVSTAPLPKKPSKIWVLAAAGISAGLIGGWVFSRMRTKTNVTVVERQKPTPPEEPKKAIELSDVPVTGQSETVSANTDKTGSCVSGYMPKGTYEKPPDMAWVCDETDPRNGAEKLRVSIINGAKGATTDAMKIFARIGWYDMAAFSVVRAGCCENAKPLALPAPSTGCSAMDEALRDVGSAVVAARSYDEPLKKYTAAIHCEMNAGKGAILRHPNRPAGGEDSAFGELVHAVQP
jgi:hypothetical protein